MAGGTIIKDISEYARNHEMFHTLVSPSKRQNDNIEGLGNDPNILRWRGGHPDLPIQTALNYRGIPKGGSQTVFFQAIRRAFRTDEIYSIKVLPLNFGI